MDCKSLTDTELLEAAHKWALNVSYYNAAEGNWSQEVEARGAAKKTLREIQAEMELRGLEFVNRGYLL